jgi:hypothetical protein
LVVIKFLNLIFVPMLSAKLTNFYCIMKKSLFILLPYAMYGFLLLFLNEHDSLR